MGGILVNVLGQEVLHRRRIEHDGAGSVDGRTSIGWVVDVAQDARLCGFGEMEVEDFDARYRGLFLLDPRSSNRIWRHGR